MTTISQAFDLHCASIRNALFVSFSDAHYAPSRRRQEGISALVERYQNGFLGGRLFSELAKWWNPTASCDFFIKTALSDCTIMERQLYAETETMIRDNEALFDDKGIRRTMPETMRSCLSSYLRFVEDFLTRVHVMFSTQCGAGTEDTIFLCLIGAAQATFYRVKAQELDAVVQSRARNGGIAPKQPFQIYPLPGSAYFSFRQKIILCMLAEQRHLQGCFLQQNALFREVLPQQQVNGASHVVSFHSASEAVVPSSITETRSVVPISDRGSGVSSWSSVDADSTKGGIGLPDLSVITPAPPVRRRYSAPVLSLGDVPPNEGGFSVPEKSMTRGAAAVEGPSLVANRPPSSLPLSGVSPSSHASSSSSSKQQHPPLKREREPSDASPLSRASGGGQRSATQSQAAHATGFGPPNASTLAIARRLHGIDLAILRLSRFLHNPWLSDVLLTVQAAVLGDARRLESYVDDCARAGLLQLSHRNVLRQWRLSRQGTSAKRSSSHASAFSDPTVPILQLLVSRRKPTRSDNSGMLEGAPPASLDSASAGNEACCDEYRASELYACVMQGLHRTTENLPSGWSMATPVEAGVTVLLDHCRHFGFVSCSYGDVNHQRLEERCFREPPDDDEGGPLSNAARQDDSNEAVVSAARRLYDAVMQQEADAMPNAWVYRPSSPSDVVLIGGRSGSGAQQKQQQGQWEVTVARADERPVGATLRMLPPGCTQLRVEGLSSGMFLDHIHRTGSVMKLPHGFPPVQKPPPIRENATRASCLGSFLEEPATTMSSNDSWFDIAERIVVTYQRETLAKETGGGGSLSHAVRGYLLSSNEEQQRAFVEAVLAPKVKAAGGADSKVAMAEDAPEAAESFSPLRSVSTPTAPSSSSPPASTTRTTAVESTAGAAGTSITGRLRQHYCIVLERHSAMRALLPLSWSHGLQVPPLQPDSGLTSQQLRSWVDGPASLVKCSSVLPQEWQSLAEGSPCSIYVMGVLLDSCMMGLVVSAAEEVPQIGSSSSEGGGGSGGKATTLRSVPYRLIPVAIADGVTIESLRAYYEPLDGEEPFHRLLDQVHEWWWSEFVAREGDSVSPSNASPPPPPPPPLPTSSGVEESDSPSAAIGGESWRATVQPIADDQFYNGLFIPVVPPSSSWRTSTDGGNEELLRRAAVRVAARFGTF